MTNFEEVAKLSARRRRETIVLIPDNCKIAKQYLDSMTNEEFITAFRKLQKLIIEIYQDVEKSPFDWGYPKVNNSKEIYASAYNRISDVFYAIAANSQLDNGQMIVDMDGYIHNTRTHKKTELIIFNLPKFGFKIDGFDKKATSFIVAYPEHPEVIKVLYYYAKAQDLEIKNCWAQHATFGSFSYRWVEDTDEQKHETIFLVKTDMSPKPLQEIQYWLYEKAKQYGYKIDKKKPFDKNCIYYKKGSKEFIHVGERDVSGKGDYKVFTKVIFRDVFTKEPEKVLALSKKIPGVFGKSDANCTRCRGRKGADEPCNMRISYELDGVNYENCAYLSFYFTDITLDTFKDIFDLFVIENKIK